MSKLFTSPDIKAALATCRFHLGLKNEEAGTATPIELGHNVIPFLGKNFTGKKSLQIDFSDLQKARRDPEAGHLGYIHRFIVILEPQIGNVLCVTSPWPPNIPEIAAYPSVEEEERQYQQAGEMIIGVPTKAPSISFLKALKVAEGFGPNIRGVKQIRAYFVDHQTVRYQRSVWIIQVRGIKPFPLDLPLGAAPLTPAEELVTENGRNHIRHIVDANTGEWLGADTIPQPKQQ